jgi:hypothetical protein
MPVSNYLRAVLLVGIKISNLDPGSISSRATKNLQTTFGWFFHLWAWQG